MMVKSILKNKLSKKENINYWKNTIKDYTKEYKIIDERINTYLEISLQEYKEYTSISKTTFMYEFNNQRTTLRNKIINLTQQVKKLIFPAKRTPQFDKTVSQYVQEVESIREDMYNLIQKHHDKMALTKQKMSGGWISVDSKNSALSDEDLLEYTNPYFYTWIVLPVVAKIYRTKQWIKDRRANAKFELSALLVILLTAPPSRLYMAYLFDTMTTLYGMHLASKANLTDNWIRTVGMMPLYFISTIPKYP
jgi:hypothetical protein